MRVGSVVYCTEQGLGILARSFYDHGVVTDVLIVEHTKRKNHYEWYPVGTPRCGPRVDRSIAKAFVRSGIDAMLFFETPFDWQLVRYCREHGVKTFLMPMYECTPAELPEQPDVFICPSELDLLEFPDGSIWIPVPVEVEWRRREKAKVFVHNAGHGGLNGRNGTAKLYAALPMVKNPVRLILRTQEHFHGISNSTEIHIGNVTVDCRVGTYSYGALFEEGDAFVFPEAFNGLSLPLQEARAAGMLVMSTDRFPMNRWLPSGPLIPPSGSKRSRVGAGFREFDEAIVEPKDIAKKVDEWYNRDISAYSESGKRWAEAMSWGVLKPRYLEVLKRGLQGRV